MKSRLGIRTADANLNGKDMSSRSVRLKRWSCGWTFQRGFRTLRRKSWEHPKATMRIVSIEFIEDKELPAKVRAKLKLPPLPPKAWKDPSVDYYEFQRAIERKRNKRKPE